MLYREPRRLVCTYGCVRCQKWHAQGDDLYESHLGFQAKHGWRERLETLGEQFSRLLRESEPAKT